MLSSKASATSDISEYHRYYRLSAQPYFSLVMYAGLHLLSQYNPTPPQLTATFLSALSTSLKIQSTTDGTKSPLYFLFFFNYLLHLNVRHNTEKKICRYYSFIVNFRYMHLKVFLFLENGPKLLMTHPALHRFLSNQMPYRMRMAQPLRLTSDSKWFMASM